MNPDTDTALDLDAVARRAKYNPRSAGYNLSQDTFALIAEMRRLRAEIEKFDLDRRVLRDDLLASQMENKRLREAVARVVEQAWIRRVGGDWDAGWNAAMDAILTAHNAEQPRATADAGEVP